jgi:ATP-dependent exoDNAse (exonuclease V) beta subunit
VAVVVPDALLGELGRAVSGVVEGAAVVAPGPAGGTARGTAALDAPVAVMGVADAKGLEFDSVIVAEPDLIISQSPRGLSDLYVALTRATQRLGVMHDRPLPEALRGLPNRAAGPTNGR